VLRVTADSNICISAMNFGGDPDKLLDMARNGDIVLAISDPIVEEVTHVLRDKFGWTDEAIKLAQARIADFTRKKSIRGERSMLEYHILIAHTIRHRAFIQTPARR
jgi:predicted nucleic acid-binding protein